MDPMSIAATIAGLVGLTTALLKTVDGISAAIKTRSLLLVELSKDLQVLRSVLGGLSTVNASRRSQSDAPLFNVIDSCRSIIIHIDQELRALGSSLQRAKVSKALAKVTFSAKMESIFALSSQLDKYKATLSIALSLRTMLVPPVHCDQTLF